MNVFVRRYFLCRQRPWLLGLPLSLEKTSQLSNVFFLPPEKFCQSIFCGFAIIVIFCKPHQKGKFAHWEQTEGVSGSFCRKEHYEHELSTNYFNPAQSRKDFLHLKRSSNLSRNVKLRSNNIIDSSVVFFLKIIGHTVFHASRYETCYFLWISTSKLYFIVIDIFKLFSGSRNGACWRESARSAHRSECSQLLSLPFHGLVQHFFPLTFSSQNGGFVKTDIFPEILTNDNAWKAFGEEMIANTNVSVLYTAA